MRYKRQVWFIAFKLSVSLFILAPVLLLQTACPCEDHGNIVVTRDVDYLAESDYSKDKDNY